MLTHDVIVIGAGPSGSFAASQLAKDGLDVLILEKNGSPMHHPVCTGIIGVEAFERFHLHDDSIVSGIRDIKFVSPTGLSLPYRPPATQAYVVDRLKFDQGIRALAIKNGAHIRAGTLCEEVRIHDTHAEVKVSHSMEWIKARAVVIASGFSRKLCDSLGLGSPSNYTQGAQTEVEMEGVKETEIHVGNAVAPGSFAWVVGLANGRARIGLTTKHHACEFLQKFLESPCLREKIKERGAILHKIIPVGNLRRTYSNRVLVVGEAAGLIKTTTHGGIYYGLISSQLAVDTLREAFRSGEFGSPLMKRYEERWKGTLDKEIKVGCRLRRFFSCLKDSQIDRFFRIAMNDGVMDIVYKKARFDWHSDLIFSLMKYSSLKKYFPAYGDS